MLCQQQTQHQKEEKNENIKHVEQQPADEATNIVQKLDSLDIVDAEHMVHHQARPPSASSNSYLMAQSVEGDPWFAKMKDENQMLERHIRTLRHIIERETQRCNFKEIIVGKSIHSPKKDKVAKEKKSDTKTETTT